MNIYAEKEERDEISLFFRAEGYETKDLMQLQCSDAGIGEFLVSVATPSSVAIGSFFVYLKSRKKKFRVHRDGTDIEAEGVSKDEFVAMVESVGEIFITPKKKK